MTVFIIPLFRRSPSIFSFSIFLPFISFSFFSLLFEGRPFPLMLFKSLFACCKGLLGLEVSDEASTYCDQVSWASGWPQRMEAAFGQDPNGQFLVRQ